MHQLQISFSSFRINIFKVYVISLIYSSADISGITIYFDRPDKIHSSKSWITVTSVSITKFSIISSSHYTTSL